MQHASSHPSKYTSDQLRCSAYLTKPVNFAKFQETVQQMAVWWFDFVVLPRSAH